MHPWYLHHSYADMPVMFLCLAAFNRMVITRELREVGEPRSRLEALLLNANPTPSVLGWSLDLPDQ